MTSDPAGENPLFFGFIGAGISALGSIGVQWYQTGSLQCVDPKQVYVALGVGFFAGTALPFLPTIGGAAALGGLANVTQYWGNYFFANQPVSGSGAALNWGLGLLGGFAGGSLKNPNLLVGQPGISSVALGSLPTFGTQSANNQWTSIAAANATISSLLRNLSAATVSNIDPSGYPIGTAAKPCGCSGK